MKKIFISFVLLFLAFAASYAVPAYPYLITSEQPDGSTISYYLHGDENFSYSTTEDGYLIKRNNEGVYEYAMIQNLSYIVPTGVKVSDIDARSLKEKMYVNSLATASDMVAEIELIKQQRRAMQAPETDKPMQRYPLKGSPKSLVILVSFSDVKFTVKNAQKEYTDLLNQHNYSKNGGTGSARDYFIASSDSQFMPNFVVVGPYQLDKTMKYYGGEKNGQHDTDPGQMIIDACGAADADVDFSEYDTDGDGRIDNVFVYYAGYNQAEGGSEHSIWPHRSSVGYRDIKIDGVQINDYACTSEYRHNSGKIMCGIGTFSHEFGHVLSLPDFYATEGQRHLTVGTWDIMDQGSYNNEGCTPPTYSSHERFFLGWLTPEILTPGQKTLEPLITSNKAYIVSKTPHNLIGKNPDPTEYFLIENRQAIGRDANGGVPATGLLITHTNYSPTTWANNGPNNDPKKMGYVIYCAAGNTSSPYLNTYPGGNNVTSCHFVLRDGEELPDPIMNITENGNDISFLYVSGDEFANVKLNNSYQDFTVYYEQGKGNNQIQTLNFSGRKLENDVNFSLRSGSEFKVRLHTDDNSGEFSRSVVIKPEKDSTINCKIDIKYQPSRILNDVLNKDALNVNTKDFTASFALVGHSLRPIYVVPPVAYEAQNITPYEFTANWSPVKDAQCYYLTAYSVEDTEGTEVEEFSTFDKEAPKGWKATFNTVSKSYKGSAPQAVDFRREGDTLITKEYFDDVAAISFWVHSNNTEGKLFIDALVNNSWKSILVQDINNTVRTKKMKLDIKENDKTRQFKIYYKNASGKGSLAFDDFTAHFAKKYNFVMEESLMLDTFATVGFLQPSTRYFYKVKASDKDPKGKYENITDYSNEIELQTVQGPSAESNELTIVVADDNSAYVVYVDDFKEENSLFIYTVDGTLVAEIPSDGGSNSFVIPQLKSNTLYILKYTTRGNNSRKDKVGKLFYSL